MLAIENSFSDVLKDDNYGLVGMHERAALIGAELKIDSAPGVGTQVTVSWKLEE